MVNWPANLEAQNPNHPTLLCTVQCALCTVYSVDCPVCPVSSAQCPLDTVHCPLSTVQSVQSGPGHGLCPVQQSGPEHARPVPRGPVGAGRSDSAVQCSRWKGLCCQSCEVPSFSSRQCLMVRVDSEKTLMCSAVQCSAVQCRVDSEKTLMVRLDTTVGAPDSASAAIHTTPSIHPSIHPSIQL
jgi:hypothetical protein